MRPLHCALLSALTALPSAAAAGVCVVNGTEHRHLFAAEARGVAREVRWLDPGSSLCAGDGDAGGVVSVYEHEDTFEGCSRLVAAGQTETLLRYADFDRCHWSSHER